MVTFQIDVPQPGEYQVRLVYAARNNRSSKTPVTVSAGETEHQVTVDQRKATAGGWSLGRFQINDSLTVKVSNRDTDGYVIVDGVQVLPHPR